MRPPYYHWRKKTGWLIGMTLALILILGYRFVRLPPSALPSSVAVVRDTLEDIVLASGTLQPITRVDVGSQASGQLTSLNVNPGDFVKQGQLLGEIDPTLSQNALRDAEVALNSLLAQKHANQALVKRAYLVLQRQRQMYQEHATARQDVETAEADWQVQQAQLASMQAQIRQQQIRVDTARTSLGYTRIVAPVSGTVVSVSTQAGQTVVAAYQIPVILQIADLSVMTIKAQIPEADFSRIRQGLAVCFTTLGAADKRYCSTLRTLEPAPEKINNALFFNALFDIDNPQGLLRPDMTAQVSIVLDRAENVLTLPLAALGRATSSHRYQVEVIDAQGKTRSRAIQTGLDDGVKIEVKTGLQTGERVVLPAPLRQSSAL